MEGEDLKMSSYMSTDKDLFMEAQRGRCAHGSWTEIILTGDDVQCFNAVGRRAGLLGQT